MTPEERARIVELLREIADDLEADRITPRGGWIHRELIFPGGDPDQPPTHERVDVSFKGVRDLDQP